MKKLFEYAETYLKNSNWKDISLLKTCLFSLGMMAGIYVPDKKKKCTFITMSILFIATYIPLMTKFIRVIRQEMSKDT